MSTRLQNKMTMTSCNINYFHSFDTIIDESAEMGITYVCIYVAIILVMTYNYIHTYDKS